MIYADELGDDAVVALTRESTVASAAATQRFRVRRGRIDAALVGGEAFDSGLAFVCGSNPFVEAATGLLLGAGYAPATIRTERFGPTG